MIENHHPADVRTSPDTVFEELSRDSGVMNTDLIDSIVEPAPTHEAEAARFLSIIEARYQAERKSHRQKRAALRFGALTAALLIAFGGTFSAAKALRWDDVLKVFASISELFLWATPNAGRDMQSVPKVEAVGSGVVVDNETGEGVLTSIQEMLSLVMDEASQKGLLALSKQYPFVSGSWYQDELGLIATAHFSIDQQPFYLEVNIASNAPQEEYILDFAMEQEPSMESIILSGGVSVALMQNYDVISAQWADGRAFYRLWGAISKETVTQIIQKMKEGAT